MGVLPTFAGVFSKQWWDAKEKALRHSIHYSSMLLTEIGTHPLLLTQSFFFYTFQTHIAV